MRGGGKQKKKLSEVVAVPEGLQIDDEKKFYKDVCSALNTSLGTGLLVQTEKQVGQRKLVYIRQPSSPTVQGRNGPLPALPLFTDERQSAWLVVELESEYGTPVMLKHVSLKLWQGATIDAAHLCFRAEWDVRDADSSNHAQPHWNVHAPRGMEAALEPEIDFQTFSIRSQATEVASFADFVKAEGTTEAPKASVTVSEFGMTVEQMHKFHFAMASTWHMSNGGAGPKINTAQELIAWIGSCAKYIKSQFAFVMGAKA